MAKKRKHIQKVTNLRRTYIKEWRKARNLTQARLVERCEGFLTAASLSRMENGKQPYSQEVLEALAEALGCAPADLIMRPPPLPGDLDLWTVIQRISPEKQRRLLRIIEAIDADEAAA